MLARRGTSRCHLGRKLTAKTEPGAAVEGHVAPADVRQLGPFPAFRAEVVGVGAVQVPAPVQVVGHEAHADALRDEHWVLADRSAATGQVGGPGRDAEVDGDGGVETEGWRR